MNLYRIYDSKAETWNEPSPILNNSVAERQFKDLANDKETEVGRHPEDFSLWWVGLTRVNSPDIETDKPYCLFQAIQLVENN